MVICRENEEIWKIETKIQNFFKIYFSKFLLETFIKNLFHLNLNASFFFKFFKYQALRPNFPLIIH